MLYALDETEQRKLRPRAFTPEFTNAEMLISVYRTDPAVVARILPRPLVPPPDPLVMAFVAQYPRTNFSPPYNEAALVVVSSLRGRLGGYCVAMPVDDDTALIAGREMHGFPKKMAERIRIEREGGRIIGTTVRKGTEILRIELDPSSPADVSMLSSLAPARVDDTGREYVELASHLFKFFPSTSGRGFDYLPRLVRQVTVFRPRSDLRSGRGVVRVVSSETDPLGELPVIGDPLVTLHGHWDNTMLPGEVVARAWNPWRFAKYAFFKSDVAVALLGANGAPALTRGRRPVKPRPASALKNA